MPQPSVTFTYALARVGITPKALRRRFRLRGVKPVRQGRFKLIPHAVVEQIRADHLAWVASRSKAAS